MLPSRRKKGVHHGISRQQIRITPILKLGVPLHPQHETTSITPDGLDHAIGCAREHLEAFGQPIHALMVDRIDASPGDAVVPARQGAVGNDVQFVMVIVVSPFDHMRESAGLILFQILMQAAAENDVEHLHAATDAQHRFAQVGESPDQRLLEMIANMIRRTNDVSRRLPVQGWIDILAALQHQAIQSLGIVVRIDRRWSQR